MSKGRKKCATVVEILSLLVILLLYTSLASRWEEEGRRREKQGCRQGQTEHTCAQSLIQLPKEVRNEEPKNKTCNASHWY